MQLFEFGHLVSVESRCVRIVASRIPSANDERTVFFQLALTRLVFGAHETLASL